MCAVSILIFCLNVRDYDNFSSFSQESYRELEAQQAIQTTYQELLRDGTQLSREVSKLGTTLNTRHFEDQQHSWYFQMFKKLL